MTHCLRLAQARKAGRFLPFERAEPVFKWQGFVEIDAGILRTPDFEDEAFLDFQAAIAGEGFRRRCHRMGDGRVPHQHDSAPCKDSAKAARSASVLTSVEAARMRSSNPLSGKSRETGTPPSTPFSAIRSTARAALLAILIVNSLKNVSFRTSTPRTAASRSAS